MSAPHIQCVVIRDLPPVLEPALFDRPVNGLMLGAIGISISVQVAGIVQVLTGYGNKVGRFDHASFAVVALLWILPGYVVFLQRRASLVDGDNSAARQTLHLLRQQAEDSYQGVRRSSHALRPVILDGLGLLPALRRFLEQFEQRTHIAVEISATEVGPLSDEVELALFRVAQECMENVRKHSSSATARLRLNRRDGQVTLSVTDAGCGIHTNAEGGIGMIGMRERLAAVGGTLRVESAPEVGARIEALIPLAE